MQVVQFYVHYYYYEVVVATSAMICKKVGGIARALVWGANPLLLLFF